MSPSDHRTTEHVDKASHAEPGVWTLLAMGDGISVSAALPDAGVVTIGRDPSSDIVLDHSSISRRHASIDVGETLRIADAGSTNGVRVGGRTIQGSIELAPGDVIELGAITIVIARGVRQLARPDSPEPTSLTGIVVANDAMRRVHDLVKLIAPTDINVIVLGETGTGKEVIAEALHRASPRASRPFVQINCAAIAETLLESELFGHERGAFTGAQSAKQGLLQAADGGTVMLDEIGDMPLATQAKLLRAIENRQVLRVGSVVPTQIDVRFVAATHRNLEAEVGAGKFRQDLFFRLSGWLVEIPPLRDRPDEIEPLARAFAIESSRAMKQRATPDFASDTLDRLRAHSWPGNVRELRNVVERAVLLSKGARILPEHLVIGRVSAAPPPLEGRPAEHVASSLRGEVEELERQRIIEALEKCGGNQTRAAELLGMSRRALVGRLDSYGITRPRKGR